MANEKITRMSAFQAAVTIIKETSDNTELIEWFENEIEKLEAKKAANRARADERATELEDLANAVLDIVPEDSFATIDSILEVAQESINENLTRQQLTNRLSVLVKAGKIEKGQVALDGKKRVAYKVVTEAENTAE